MISFNVNGRILSIENPLVMGIVNLSSDSFYKGSYKDNFTDICRLVEQMILDGAAVIDIGAFSSQPGAKMIPIDEELNKLSPVVKGITKEFPDIVLSIDTFRGEVVNQLSDITGFIVNDISGFSLDSQLLESVARNNLPYILMHLKGNPENMMDQTDYKDLIFEMLNYFGEKLTIVKQKGIHQIIIDPGIGFAKNINQNFKIMNKLSVFNIFEYPLMVGISRKSFIYKTLGTTPENGLNGTTALHMAALLNGAKILRVHDVKEAVETIKLYQNLSINVKD